MAIVRRTIASSQDAVFAVLTNPYSYPHWLVGCKDIRAVDDGWPAEDSAFHHRVGLAGPLTVADNTKVLEIAAPHLLSLEVRARPLGRGRATFRLTDATVGDGPVTTLVEIDEVPIGLLAPTKPLTDPLVAHRNRKSLADLDRYIQERSRPAATDRTTHEPSAAPNP